ncbi:hypothetical protein OQA88_2922 [Cercophora sp. LCS_1]
MSPSLPDSSFDSPASASQQDPACPFCNISQTYPPYPPTTPPSSESSIIAPTLTSPHPQTFIVLSTPLLIAFLDIMPLSPGHILLCPRAHRPKLTDATPSEAAEMGRYLRVLSAAVGRATGVKDWNVVQNNGAAAAQVVMHVHYHIIPRPELRATGRERFTSTMFGRGQREDLDEEEAAGLAEKVRRAVGEVLSEEGEAGAKL